MNLFVFEGGIKGISYLGVLHYLYINDKLNNVKKMFGCSTGSIIITLLSILKSPKNVFYSLKDRNRMILSTNILKDLNIIDTNKVFNNIFENYLPKDITISEFNKKYNCDVNYIVSNVTLQKSEIFNSINTPNVKVLDAIKSSCSIPILFSPIYINNYLYMDGAIFSYHNLIYKHIHHNSIVVKALKRGDGGRARAQRLINCICRNVYSIDLKNTKYWWAHGPFVKHLSKEEYDELFLYGIKNAYETLKH